MTRKPPLPPPLAPFEGKPLPTPDWFSSLQAEPVETGVTDFDGGEISWKAWGKRGNPVLVLIHGGTAHKGWWDAIGPFLAREDYFVVAPDLPGMGESSWWDHYAMDHHARAILAGAKDAAGDALGRPIFVGHSFGGFVTLKAATTFGEDLRAAVVMDSPIRKPDAPRDGPPPKRGGKVYPELAQALARFRLIPEQEVEDLWLVDHIARGSLKQVEGGHTWRFDPGIWSKLRTEPRNPEAAAAALKCPIAFVRGAQSVLMQSEVWTYMQSVFTDSPFVTVPDAKHHLVLDQPLATTAVVHALAQGWARQVKDRPVL